MAMAKTKAKKNDKQTASKIDAHRFPKIVRKRNQVPRGDHHGMKLLLTEAVAHLGKQGEVVEVKPGYGRNFLIPQGLATYVTSEAMVRIEKHKAKVEALRIARLNDLKMLAREIEKHSVTIEANANEEGHLYGSVTAVDIVRSLQKENLKIEESNIRLEGPLKELGLYQVAVQIDPEVSCEIKVWVVPTAGKAAEPPKA